MLKNFALIASAVCGITAITTSLRALGRSREKARADIESNVRTGCRISESSPSMRYSGSSIPLHLGVTVVWLILSLVFAIPLFNSESTIGMVLWILPFLALIVLLVLIWLKILHKK